jgi:hypothetical protein
MQSFGAGALLAVSTLHVYPEVVLALNESGVPQWQGAALVLTGLSVMILLSIFLTNCLHDHNHMTHSVGLLFVFRYWVESVLCCIL